MLLLGDSDPESPHRAAEQCHLDMQVLCPRPLSPEWSFALLPLGGAVTVSVRPLSCNPVQAPPSKTCGATLPCLCPVFLDGSQNLDLTTPSLKIGLSWGTWLAQLEEHATLDLRVVS